MINADINVLSEKDADSISWNIQDQFKGMSLEDINDAQPKFPYAVCLLNTTGSLNIGVALRSAVLFGAEKFYIVGKRRYDKRSTVGAQNYINLDRVEAIDDQGKYDVDKILSVIENDGFTPVLIETGGKDISNLFPSLDSGAKPCFILGEEKDGIPEEILNKGYQVYKIPTFGVLRSLNVSVAASIVMYEASKKLSNW